MRTVVLSIVKLIFLLLSLFLLRSAGCRDSDLGPGLGTQGIWSYLGTKFLNLKP